MFKPINIGFRAHFFVSTLRQPKFLIVQGFFSARLIENFKTSLNKKINLANISKISKLSHNKKNSKLSRVNFNLKAFFLGLVPFVDNCPWTIVDV
ncbi:hypothetical protein BpHYR1_003216 [Brachionus plicatilis]|uniref:Uncharacterized protein n=1 Tax=Brachionus plicatilis TaxID=10195 RepID=A0A3M7PRY7_BRAPC|nr:hypothetical protein BpHYR1_003216 [Brachionus plicatilis]